MPTLRNSNFFFKNGNSCQFKFCLQLYPQALKIKEAQKCKEGDLIRLDKWYQNELPDTIQKRGRNAHIIHKELVQAMKWKQTRGKFFPQLTYLVKLNTERTVFNETKKAFKKLPNLEQAVTALSTLKGVGVSMASALLSAACPQNVPFMADECLLAIPEIGAIDYTTNQYLQFVHHIQEAVKRLNSIKNDSEEEWNAHTVELSLWAHFVISKSYPSLLEDMPGTDQSSKISSTTTLTMSVAERNLIGYSMNESSEDESTADSEKTIILHSGTNSEIKTFPVTLEQISNQKIDGDPSSMFPIANIPKTNGAKRRNSLDLSTSSLKYLYEGPSEKKNKPNSSFN